MFRAFCDLCGNECVSEKSITRRFEALKRAYGLEILPLHNKQFAKDKHICDDCMAELLYAAATSYTKSPTVKYLNDNINQAVDFKKLRSSLENKEADLTSLTDEITSLIQEAKGCIEEVKSLPSVEQEKIKVLEATIASLESRTAAKIKREETDRIQSEIDEKEYPEYTARVNKRERIRAS